MMGKPKAGSFHDPIIQNPVFRSEIQRFFAFDLNLPPLLYDAQLVISLALY